MSGAEALRSLGAVSGDGLVEAASLSLQAHEQLYHLATATMGPDRDVKGSKLCTSNLYCRASWG